MRQLLTKRFDELVAAQRSNVEIIDSLQMMIQSLSEQEIKALAKQVHVGRFPKVDEDPNWMLKPQVKDEYIFKIIEELFYEVTGEHYEDYMTPVQNPQVSGTNEMLSKSKETNVADKIPQAQQNNKVKAVLHELTNSELYEAILEVDTDKERLDIILSEKFIDTYEASTIKEAIQLIDKQYLIDELERLLNEKEPQLIEQLNVQDVSIASWQRWYEVYGQQAFRSAKTTSTIEAPNKIVWYDGLDLEIDDQYVLVTKDDLYEEHVIVCNGENGETFVGLAKLETVKRTEQEERVTIITWLHKNITVDVKTLQNERYTLLVVKKEDGAAWIDAVETQRPYNASLYSVPFNLTVETLQTINTPLCIDFGTTNTTLGCYLPRDYVSNMPQHALALGNIHYDGYVTDNETKDGVNFIHFYEGTLTQKQSLASRKNYTIPTVVYVKKITQQDVVYAYGYDALAAARAAKEQREQKPGTLIYGLKRWMNNLDELERIVDEAGNTMDVKRETILHGYIAYVLNRAKHQVKGEFKQLHFSAPIKMKAKFIEAFTSMLPQYDVIQDAETLDEGITVVYDSIRQEIEKHEGALKGRALILDCGGGTTDLANCEYSMERDFFGSPELRIQTRFTNGNPNFGGNNLTYRIMQMLKIKLAVLYRGAASSDEAKAQQTTVDQFLKVKDEAIAYINEHESNVIETLYATIDETYKKEESYIPTAFAKYEHLSSSYVEKVSHNFYFLWDIAENMKREFFNHLNKVSIDLDADLLMQVGHFRLHLQQQKNELTMIEHAPQHFSFTIREIEQLIVPEIYAVEHQFLNAFNVMEFMSEGATKMIKLTGQSCRIPYFRDMLKEFIPGKYIKQSTTAANEQRQGLELKLACVRGAVHYWRDMKRGEVASKLEPMEPIIPYDVFIEEPTKVMTEQLTLKENNVLIAKGVEIGQSRGVAVIRSTATSIQLRVQNDRKQIGDVRTIVIKNPTIDAEYKDTVQLQQELAKNKFEQSAYLDALNNVNFRKYTLLFAFTDADAWGITIKMATFNDELGKWHVQTHYEPFEDAKAYENFFDGKH